ncbi:Methylthioribulose-1-phosphate dehydratase [Tulasnella sp. 403]|nr:Methylthioribulose-1-phosphate dehydratase [Tulasnella sp. 403]
MVEETHIAPDADALVTSTDPSHGGLQVGMASSLSEPGRYDISTDIIRKEREEAFPLDKGPSIVYIAPSGVQKERIKPEHIFVLPYPQAPPPTPYTFLRKPELSLKESACTPLFWNAFDLRDAGSCIHTHSQHAVMATLLWPGETFEISHQEMIKGVRLGGIGKAMSYLDKLVVPIIENTPHEEDLRDSMAEAMKQYPDAAGVLVRRHGVYVWGPDWERAKTQAECLDYLFEIGVKMKLANLPTTLD